MKITIAGAGYVGLITGVCLSHKGLDITLIDTDEAKIALLQEGKAPFTEKGLPELLAECGDNMVFTTDPKKAYAHADVIMFAVPTPDRRDGSANLAYLFGACELAAAYCAKGCLVVIKSTVPVGTCDKIERFFNETTLPGLFRVVSNPEFLAQGTAVADTFDPARIVIGAEDDNTAREAMTIYDSFTNQFVLTDRRTAEMIKYASNDFLALKISYINEIANLCEIVGADCETVSLGMGLDPRIGLQYLRPGTGYGGSCFPKDTKALHWLARYHDYELKTIKATIEVNETQKIRLFKKTRKYLKNLNGATVAVLGLAFKPGTDDLREAPSVDVIRLLAEEGGSVRAWDPTATDRFIRQHPGLIHPCPTIDEALRGADLCLIMTEWDAIKNCPPETYARLMKTPIIIDGRNCYTPGTFVGTGVLYDSIGRQTVNSDIVTRIGAGS
ncbi:MAG: UDP-glucose/GDP-mannose dehydrogenase family protein [Peptococcaceae bacterium]|nr:UDP-glucose/GDP-mannose dehydrogenase family protein [Peptococcaceae bacterium]